MAKYRGFTLVELVIVVAVVGILVAIAWPSYQSSVIRSHRAEAQNFMMDLAQREQAYLLDRRSYATLAQLGVPVPTRIAQYYAIIVTVVAGPPPTFTIQGVPLGGTIQASDPILTLNQAGQKTPVDKW